VSATPRLVGDCEGCDGTGKLVPSDTVASCRLCGGTGTRTVPRVGPKVLELRVSPGAYSVLSFKVGERDAALVLPHNVSKVEQEDAVREITDLLEVIRTLPTES
jgi:hypothetical protein